MPDNRPQTMLMLWAAVAMPLFYFGAQLVAAPFYPGYHFATDTASMLGTSASRHPEIFNTGAILTGIAGLAGAFGLFLGLRRAAAPWLRILIAIGVLSNGVMSLKAGLYPMPDPRHTTWQFLLLPVLITPLLLLGATWRVPWLRIYLLLNGICLLCLIPSMMHRMAPIFPEGTMQRLFALVIFVPVGVVALPNMKLWQAAIKTSEGDTPSKARLAPPRRAGTASGHGGRAESANDTAIPINPNSLPRAD